MKRPQPDPELRESLARLVEGESEPADEQRVAAALRAEPELTQALRAQLELDALLRQEATGLPGEFVESVAQRIEAVRSAPEFSARVAAKVSGRRSRWRYGLALAAMVALVAGAAVWWRARDPRGTRVELAQVAGVVSWSNDRGAWESGLTDGALLGGGTLSVEGETSSAVLVFRDGTRVTLTGNAEVTFSDDGQKRLRCTRGTLTANVTPQPRDRPMLVRTANAEIEVVGTVFSVEAELALTSVSVERGAVRVRRIDDPRSALVAAEQVAVVDAESDRPITPRQTPAARTRWQAAFETPVDDRWSALWRPAEGVDPHRVAAVPVLVGGKQKFLRPGVKVYFDPVASSGVAVSSRTVLRGRVRSAEAQQLSVFVCTNGANGGFAGNFGRVIALSAPPDAAGWREFELGLADLEPVPVWRDSFPRAEGTIVRFLLLTALEGFEIAALEIAAP